MTVSEDKPTWRDRSKMWPKEAYDKKYHTVAECEAVIKSLREMVDQQQAYINKLLLQRQKV